MQVDFFPETQAGLGASCPGEGRLPSTAFIQAEAPFSLYRGGSYQRNTGGQPATCSGFPLGGSCLRSRLMRGRFPRSLSWQKDCAQRPAACTPCFSPPLGTRSPPHPSRLRRATFPPRGRLRAWQVNDPYPVCTKRLPQPAQLGGGPLPASDAGPQARIQKERDTPKDIPNQSGESRGEKLSPLVFFPPFLTGEMEAAGRHPPGRCAPRPLRRHGPKGPLPTGARPPAPLGRL